MGPKKQKRELPEDFDPVYPYDIPQLQINPPFVSGNGFDQSVDGVLSLHIAPPLVFDNTKALTLAFGGGLQLFGNKLIVATEGSGLTTNTEGKLVLQVSSPLTLGAGGISLPLGPGLSSSGGNLSLQVTSPLQLQGNSLALPIGAGLQNTDGAMTVKLGDGLTTNSNEAVTVRVGNGLQLSEGLLTVPATAPLVSGPTGISFNFSPTDFALDNGSLSLVSKEAISVAPPLQSTEGGISLKYSDTDFSVDDNGTLTLAPGFKPYTLWTGKSLTENVILTNNTSATPNGTFFLCLTRVGGLVLGSFALKTSSLTFNNMTQNVTLVFDNVGRFQKDSSTYKGEFGFRSGNNVIAPQEAGLSPAWLMPSSFIYPTSASGSTITSLVKINQSYVNVDIKVNANSTQGYSLEFDFENVSISFTFSTSYGTFCYVAQNV